MEKLITARIESYEQKQGSRGYFHKFKTDKGVINCFDLPTANAAILLIGQIVDMKIEENGIFKNLIAIQPSQNSQAPPTQAGAPVSNGGNDSPVQEGWRTPRQIIRTDCLKAAVEYINAHIAGKIDGDYNIYKIAEEFENWVFR